MARDFAKQFYASTAWRKCRAAYIKSRQGIDGGLCEVCRRDPGVIVHHMIWLTPENIDDPNVSLNFSFLRLECVTCHNRESENENQYTFDDEGQPVPLPGPGHTPPFS